jgi:hypothetical protein
MNLKINKDTFKNEHVSRANVNVTMYHGNMNDFVLLDKLIQICFDYKNITAYSEIINLNEKKIVKMPKHEDKYKSIIDNSLSIRLFKN